MVIIVMKKNLDGFYRKIYIVQCSHKDHQIFLQKLPHFPVKTIKFSCIKQHQHVIQFCVKLGYNLTKMYGDIRKVFGESAVSCVTTFQWHSLFISGKESVKDEEKKGKLTITKTFENITQVEQVWKKDLRVSSRMIMESTGIPTENNYCLTHFIG